MSLTNCIVFKNLDGSCGIIIPAINTTLTIDQIATKDVPSGLTHRITDITNIPTDRTFRNAWTDDHSTITVDVDIPKARIIQMDNIHVLIKSKIEELNDAYMIALETNDLTTQSSLATQKQVIRNLPTTYDLSIYTTPETLKNAIRSELLP